MVTDAIRRGIRRIDVEREGFRNPQRLLIDERCIGMAPIAPPTQAVHGEAVLLLMRHLDQPDAESPARISVDDRRIGLTLVAGKIGLTANRSAEPTRWIGPPYGHRCAAAIDRHRSMVAVARQRARQIDGAMLLATFNENSSAKQGSNHPCVR